MKYSEETLKSWTAPLSKTEEERAENAIKMIKKAISEDDNLRGMDIEVFTQGSFANNTNVRTDSDVDVCVMLKDVFHAECAKGKENSDYGFVDSELTYEEYRRMIKAAIVEKFRKEYVHDGKKSIKIDENTYHVKADVVPTFQLRNYYYNNSVNSDYYVEGTWFTDTNGRKVKNYPKVHINNGCNKNKDTNGRYKKLVRIMKHIKNEMVDDGETNGEIITSFLVECLIWNVPDRIITGYPTWTETVKQTIKYLYDEIDNRRHLEWGEVSEILYLFKGKKWTDNDAKQWLIAVWNYLEY